jgi:hypothetical protein
MNQRLNYIDGRMRDWGFWVLAGQTSQGVFSTSQWSAGRPVEARRTPASRRKQKPLVSGSVPHSTRATRPKVPCLRIAYREESMHKAVILLPGFYKPIICCLYLKGFDFYDTSLLLGLSSKKVGQFRHKLLKTLDTLL